MGFDENDIAAQKTEMAMKELLDKCVLIGAEYNRVFEMIYLLFTRIDELEKRLSQSRPKQVI